MTNKDMVNRPAGKPSDPDPGTSRPAPEDAEATRTRREPLDSPGPKPMTQEPRTRGLKTG